MPIINRLGVDFEIIGCKESITLADSFVFNKIGSGNGEGKLYLGIDNDINLLFWDNFVDEPCRCFLLKEDIEAYLNAAQPGFLTRVLPYRDPLGVANRFHSVFNETLGFPDDFLRFDVVRSNVGHPGIYVNSGDYYYKLIRKIGLPKLSHLAILKLRRMSDSVIFYYFKIDIEYPDECADVQEFAEAAQEEDVARDPNLTETERTAIIKARKGQGVFRDDLLRECQFCPITLVDDEKLLIASHIKPWAADGITNLERIDHKNGLLLTPTFDKLFDKGLISFTDDKKMMVSPWLSEANQARLGIYDGLEVPYLPLDERRINYMEYHRRFVFKR